MNEHKNIYDNNSLLLFKPDFIIKDKSVLKHQLKTVTDNLVGGSNRLLISPHKTSEIYRPQVSMSRVPRRGGMSEALKINVNLPKLIHQENISEIKDDDYNLILTTLQKRLDEMGIETSISALANATVVSIHSGKNIIMPQGMSPGLVLHEIEKSNMSRRLDVIKSSYKNDGSCLRFNNTETDLAIYDKGREHIAARRSIKRSEEKDSFIQHIDKDFFEQNKILRFEVRLTSSRKIRNVLSKIGYSGLELTFANLFDSNIARAINMLYWKEISDACRINLLVVQDDNILLKKLLMNHKWKKALALFGLTQALKSSTARGLKSLLGQDNSSVNNLFKELKQIEPNQSWLSDIFDHITQTIDNNQALSLK